MPNRHAKTALGLLCLVGLFNYVDRVALSILQVPIKAALGLSDTQLGLLTGLAFFLPYTFFSWPVARLADRHPRKLVLACVLAIWSTATALVSVARGFTSLVILRMGVALGEAGCLPTSYSLIGDYFPPHRRAKAIAIFVLAFPVGSMLGVAGGGVLAAAIGWRQTFLVIGLAGLALAPLVLWLLREPPRGGMDEARPAADMQVPPLAEAIRMLWRAKGYRYLALGAALTTYVVAATLSWGAPFYVRIHHLPLSRVALLVGAVAGIGGGVGSLLGGALSDRLGKDDRRWYAWLPGIAAVLLIPLGLAQYLVADAYLSLALGLLATALLNVFIAPVYAVTQALFGPNVRAFAAGTIVAMTAILGAGFGPFATGAISDYLAIHHAFGAESLRYALCTPFLAAALAAAAFAQSARHLRHHATVGDG